MGAISLAAASLLFALLLLEGATRALGTHAASLVEPPGSDRALWRYDRTKGWFHTPGAHARCDYGGPDAGDVRINSLGLRGPEVGRSEPRTRVVVLGDSFVFGVGVDEEHVFSSQLEKQLAAWGHGVEVVNLGVSGYSTDQELILLRELGPALVPGVAILVMCDNDFEGNTLDFVYRRYYKPHFDVMPSGEVVLRGSPVPRLRGAAALRLWLGEHSNLWNAVRSRRSSVAILQGLLDRMQPATPTPSSVDRVQLAGAIVRELKRVCATLGAALVVVNTGHRGEHTGYFHALRPILDAEGIPYEGMEQALGSARDASPDKLWDFKDDTHWNIDAHRVAARTMASFLERRVYRAGAARGPDTRHGR